jgi:hypothetical protein
MDGLLSVLDVERETSSPGLGVCGLLRRLFRRQRALEALQLLLEDQDE